MELRDQNGRFAAGASGNYAGRPRAALSELCRNITHKRRLVQMLGEMADGVGRFRDIDAATRLKAVTLLLSYGFGPAVVPASAEVDDEPRVRFVKNIVVDDPEYFESRL